MDWSAWKKIVELLQSNPELILALAVIVGAVFWFAWWLRSHISKEHVAALNTQIASLEGQLQDTREDLRFAKEEQQHIKQEVQSLKAENDKLMSQIRGLQATAPQSQQPSLTIIYNSSSAIAVRINSIDQANTNLGTTLQTITGKLQVTEGSDTAKLRRLH